MPFNKNLRGAKTYAYPASEKYRDNYENTFGKNRAKIARESPVCEEKESPSNQGTQQVREKEDQQSLQRLSLRERLTKRRWKSCSVSIWAWLKKISGRSRKKKDCPS